MRTCSLAGLAVCLLLGGCGSGTGNSTEQNAGSITPIANASSTAASVSSPRPPPAVKVESEGPALTAAQNNARRSAEQYLSMTAFSKAGLIEQLSSDAGEGYSLADAKAAVESMSVDWNENAARAGKQYLDMSGFSCKGLIEQLSSSAGDKYTVAQATYGARAAGAC